MTFAANSALTAAQLNTYLRDNLNETAPAKATTPGGYFVSTALNAIAERVGQRQTIFTSETTTSTAYTDLTTNGPTVTATTAGLALVIWTAQLSNSGTGFSRCSIEVTGAGSSAASDARCIAFSANANDVLQSAMAVFYDDLTPGSNTFTMKYKVSSGTGTFSNRRLIVLPY